MVQIDPKYLPEKAEQVMFLQAQVNERKKINYRNLMELKEATHDGERNKIVSLELTLKDTCERIDIYQEELDKLKDVK